MFVKNAYYLSTFAMKNDFDYGGRFSFGLLSSRKVNNGLLVKDMRGNDLKLKTRNSGKDTHLLLDYTQVISGNEINASGRVTDDVLAERIITYMVRHFGEHHTNCSTFVEYLRTGIFSEGDYDKHFFMFSGGMNRYTDQPIRPGDSLCVFYYNKWGKSRRASRTIQKHYKKSKRVGSDLRNLKGKEKTFSPKELLDAYACGFFADYHFMHCIEIKDGQPVFIQQMGRNDPGKTKDLNKSPIVVTVGTTNMGRHDVPACVFIKKGRN